MVRPRLFLGALCIVTLLAAHVARAEDGAQPAGGQPADSTSETKNAGQEKLDQATEAKLSAEDVGDLNKVITLCEEALEAGLDEANTKFANELLASTLTQRAELACTELFERQMPPARARKILQGALSDLEQTLKIDKEQSVAQYLAGRLYGQLGEKEKAIAALDVAIRLSDEDPEAKARALVLRANLKTDEAARQADFDEAARLTPRDPDVLRYRGMFHLSQGKTEAALTDFLAALEIEPDHAETHEAAGLALSQLQKYDEAMEQFNKAIELAPESAGAYTNRGRVRAIKGDTAAALVDVEQALKLQPGSVQALQLHAALLSSTGKFDRALSDLNLLRRAMPDNVDLLLQIAALHQASHQPAKAIATYDMVLVTDADNINAYRGRADSYLSQGKQAEALADYQKANEIDPKNSGVLNNLAWVLATSTDDKLRDGKRAIELAKQACEVTEYKQAHILSTLAAGYAESGDFGSAVDWSKKAVALGADGLKEQLQKELESYEAHKPWREALPPQDDPSGSDQGSSPDDNETARKRES